MQKEVIILAIYALSGALIFHFIWHILKIDKYFKKIIKKIDDAL